MEAELTLILFLLFFDILLTFSCLCILVYNKIMVIKLNNQDSQLVTEIKEYFKKEGIRKIGK